MRASHPPTLCSHQRHSCGWPGAKEQARAHRPSGQPQTRTHTLRASRLVLQSASLPQSPALRATEGPHGEKRSAKRAHPGSPLRPGCSVQRPGRPAHTGGGRGLLQTPRPQGCTATQLPGPPQQAPVQGCQARVLLEALSPASTPKGTGRNSKPCLVPTNRSPRWQQRAGRQLLGDSAQRAGWGKGRVGSVPAPARPAPSPAALGSWKSGHAIEGAHTREGDAQARRSRDSSDPRSSSLPEL